MNNNFDCLSKAITSLDNYSKRQSGRISSAVPNSANVPKSKEIDPLGIKPHEPGAKLDAGKAPITQGIFQYFPRALKAVAEVSQAGASKYMWKGWEKVPDGINRYGNALGRHILAEEIEGPLDSQLLSEGFKILHKAQVAWNALAQLELYLREQEAKVPSTGLSTQVVLHC